MSRLVLRDAADRAPRVAFGLLIGAIMVFLAVPLVVVVLVSFSNGHIVQLPPKPWGVGAYRELFGSDQWLSAFRQSVQVALPAAALATALGTLTSVALQRSRVPLKVVWQGLGLLPLVIPIVAYALGVFVLFAKLHIIGSYWGLVAIDALLALPAVLLLCGSAVARVPENYDLAAMSLGATRARAIVGITLRLMIAPIAAAFVLAFLLSFGESTFIVFLGGTDWNTLPRTIYSSLQFGVAPVVAAVSTLLIVISGVLIVVASRLGGIAATRAHGGPRHAGQE